MLHLEIIDSYDSELLGEYLYNFPYITAGSNQVCQLILEDKKVNPIHVKLEPSNEGVWVKSFRDAPYLSNGIKVIGNTLHKRGENFSIGSTIFKVLDCKEAAPTPNQKELLEELAFSDPPTFDLVEAITNELMNN